MAGSAAFRSTKKDIDKLLVLAADDMQQVVTAARAIKRLNAEAGISPSPEQYLLVRALETGLATAYMRPFSTSKTHGPTPLSTKQFVPSQWKALHKELHYLRNKVYAHTDAHVNRDASVAYGKDQSEVSGHMLSVHTVGLSPEKLDEIIAMCEEQAQRFEAGALDRVMLGS